MKSLRQRLQLWHALVLVVVLVAFGVIVSMLSWRTRLGQIDSELDHATEVVFSQFLRLIPPANEPLTGSPNALEADPAVRLPPPEPKTAAQGGVPRPESALTLFPNREIYDSNRAQEFEKMFGGEGKPPLYFVIWNRAGKRLRQSANAPEVPFPGLSRDSANSNSLEVRMRGDYRERVQLTWWLDLNVLVGRSVEKELATHRGLNFWLGLAGLAVLGFGLAGGWWWSRHALLPIERMTATAKTISASNLSQRLDPRLTDSELGTLVVVLNDTFSRLEAAFLQQTRFTADASHELRTPLAVIHTNVELALTRPRSPEEYRATLETCLRASQRMKALIDNLLTLAHFDAGRPTLRIEAVDLPMLVEDCVEMLRPLAEKKQIQISYLIPPCRVSGDYDRLAQVFTNLLSNAIRYNHEHGSIDISAICQADQICVRVADTGMGIPADSLSQVFERFYRVDKARARSDGGSGLGLSICRSIAEAHGGSIGVTSNAAGTVFEVRLPGSLIPTSPSAPETPLSPPAEIAATPS